MDLLAEGPDGTVVVDQQHQDSMRRALRAYNSARQNNMLLMLSFTTITDYLYEL